VSIRSIIFMTLLSLPFLGQGQGVRCALGTDPSMWVSGWHNVQMGAQLHPELSLVVGAGALRSDRGLVSAVLRPRPANFEKAYMVNMGVRFHPANPEGRTVQGLIGLDYTQEVFIERVALSLDDGAEITGRQQHGRRDLRMLVGGRVALSRAFTLSTHVGVGYRFKRDAQWLPAGQPSALPMTRLLGMELMWWI